MATPSPIPQVPETEPRTPRAPQQERGQRRVEQILDAAESVFTEMGVDAASMQAIADRADSSVGSLYHFFPNKDAIVEAIGRRYADRMRETNEQAMPLELAHLPPEELFERVITAQISFVERTPGFTAVHESIQRNCPAINDALNAAIAGHVGKFLSLRYPKMREEERWASAMVSVATVHAMVHLAFQVPQPHRGRVIEEAQRMLIAHYTAYDAAKSR